MLAVDTNIVVRYLVHDHPAQSAKARRLIDGNDIFVPATVLLETEWVLRSFYGVTRTAAVERLRALAGLPRVSLEAPFAVAQAFGWADGGMDFADAIHLAVSASCDAIVSFDRDLVRRAVKQGLSARVP